MSILGTKLKQIRESKGIPLDIIYHHTKISVENLRMLESNQFEKIPDAYLSAFVKSYGKEIGLTESFLKDAVKFRNDDELMDLLFSGNGNDEEFRTKAAKYAVGKTGKMESGMNPGDQLTNEIPKRPGNMISENLESFYHRYKKAAFGIVSGLLIIYVIFSLTKSDAEDAKTVTAMSFDQVVDSVMKAQAITEKPVQKTTEIPVVVKKTIRTLYIKAPAESCYVQITFPDSTGKSNIIDFIIPPNRGIVRKAEYFDLKIGRVQAVEIYLDNQKLTTPKVSGVVSNWRVDETLLKNQ